MSYQTILSILKKLPYIICAAVLFLWLVTCSENRGLKEENDRLSNNITAVTHGLDSFKTKSGKDAVRIRELEVTKSEFEELCVDQVRIIDDMGLKIKRLQSMSTTATQTDAGGTVQLKDTVFIYSIDTIMVAHPAKVFSWKDEWNEIDGVIEGDSVTCRYHGTDTLNIAVSRVPKKFLFFRFGTKYIEATVSNANKNTKIVYTKHVKLKD